MSICTQKIIVTGLVQGIGFRPFVAELAEELELAGQVKNLGGVVEIIIQGNKQAVDTFIHRLNLVSENGSLPGCRIDSLQVEDCSVAGNCIEEVVQEVAGVEKTLTNGQSEMSARDGQFRIVESDNTREQRRFLPVDLPTCDRCVAEMHDTSNRRYRYPFISCTACGPRFSIQKAVPYDRDTITMDDFKMCDACWDEYTQKGNIRRHAQTIACKDCGPKLRYVAMNSVVSEKDVELGAANVESETRFTQFGNEQQAIAQAITDLKNGKIGAIKDIGGFHFAFSPMNSEAARRLREFKNRDKKPFAVMFLNIDAVKEYCEVSAEEEKLLLSSARPIVLLNKKKDFVPEICGESDRIGALLPCNPLQILLLEETGPLVMTSGNRGGEPIIISEEEMEPHLHNGIDFMLTHDREILTPLDDSIFQVTKIAVEESVSHVQLIRRARGLVPEPISMIRKLPRDTFAAGGDLKATFALGRDELVYMSQYFGDLEDVRCMESRKRGLARMQELLEIRPMSAVCDMHPAYVSVKETRERYSDVTQYVDEKCAQAGQEKCEKITGVQHHHAHVASVIAEHGLEGKVLGIACDGTGFGTDGTIWGSEFLLCEDEKMTRNGHFSTVKLLGGDASAKQADMTLFSYMLEARERGMDVEAFFEKLKEKAQTSTESDLCGEKAATNISETDFNQKLQLQEMAWKQNINTAYSSSMGRLFDAAAALLDICHCNSYEGECAIMLEQMAHIGKAMLDSGASESAETEQFAHISKEKMENILRVECAKIDGIWRADGVKLLVDLYHLKNTYFKEVLAYFFHRAVATAIVEMAEKICEEQEVKQIALSGGSFLNRILTSVAIGELQENGKDVYINEKVPCGDGGIALGQMYLMTYEK